MKGSDTPSVSSIPPLASPLVPGFRLDRYELLCPIAEGGMASVWIARQTGKHGFQKLVAIKTVLPKYAAEEHFQRMFVDEAHIASRIEHVNVTQILDVGEQSGVTYLVMEYVDGDSLTKIQKALQKDGVAIPQGVALRVMADVCGGLQTAHELRDAGGELLGVVHRDVSPQNVLVSTKGVAKLIDFGIAKARDRLAGETNTDTMKGKIRYMAPEQALGLAVDRRADIWAVGSVLHFLLAGKPPFEGDNDVQTILLLTNSRSPPALPSSVHPAVAAVVRRALQHESEERFATAAEMQAAIENAMVEAKVPTTTSAVAAFLEEHVGGRAQRRREAIELGLKAASEREKYADMMKSNADADGSGSHSPVGLRASAILAAAMSDPPPPGSSSLQATLGPAAVAVRARRKSRSPTVTIAAVVAGVALGFACLFVLRRSPTHPATAAPVDSAATIATTSPSSSSLPQASAPAAPSAVTAAPSSPSDAAPSAAANEPHRPVAGGSAHARSGAAHAPTTAAAPPTATVKPRINDGF
jgi:serine/threonine-protein kinase